MSSLPILNASRTLAVLLALPFAAAGASTEDAELASRLVQAYYAGDVDSLRPHLSPKLVFQDPVLDQRMELAEFLEMVGSIAKGQRERKMEVGWAGAGNGRADVRGTWSWIDVESGRELDFKFSIELGFEDGPEGPRVVTWLDDFRRRMWKPAAGDRELATEHFRVVYYSSELAEDDAKRLGETLETWYEKTCAYLGRSFADGYRLHINVAGGHESPFASDPGPDAFMLVADYQARRDYGFSLVHELTHNLMGLSWLSSNEFERNGTELRSGNRLLDEGFAVYVEEKLTGEGPRVWPNFGTETHAAYWQLREEAGEPIWAPLEAEVHRQHGNVRLAYLAQASFIKHLVDSHGLERFEQLFDVDPESAEAIYGRGLESLEADWRAFLEARFVADAEAADG